MSGLAAKLLNLFRKKTTTFQYPHWHHDFLAYPPAAIGNSKSKKRLFYQVYKGIYIVFWRAPTPEDIRMAKEDFDHKYPDCEDCGKNLFVCTCMVELEGFTK